MLLCSLIEIVTDNFGDLTSSDNYRAIAQSPLLLWVILLSQGWKVSSDQLQFGYQKLSSTILCTGTVSSVTAHVTRAGSEVAGALLD